MIDYNALKPGVSGIMRVKDDAQFIEPCILSCINALDELVIVYNDCTDSSPQEIEHMRALYPEKIHVYPYNHRIMALNLSQEDYELVKNLPDNDPRLLCNYYNFALDKVSYQYAVKIDADQIYFPKKMDEWCSLLRNNQTDLSSSVIYGAMIFVWMKIVSRINKRKDKIVHILPNDIPEWMKTKYLSFVRYVLKKDKACVMISGLNTVNINGCWYVPLGKKGTTFNALPPFNGIGDHVFFKVKPECKYIKFDCPEYSKHRSEKFTLIEKFICPDLYLIGGFFWFHLNMHRKETYNEVRELFKKSPNLFMPITSFLSKNYYHLDKLIEREMFGLDSKSLMHFVYPFSKDDLIKNLELLDKCLSYENIFN